VRLPRPDLTPWRERAWIVVPALAFFLLNCVFFVAGRTIDARRSEALDRELASARERRASAQTAREDAERQSGRVEGIERAIDEFYGKRLGTLNETMAAMVDEIHQVCRKSGVRPGQISYGINGRSGSPLTAMTISFSVTGDYDTLRRLLKSFEDDPRWFVVRTIQVVRKPESVGSTEISLTAVTYFHTPVSPLATASAPRETTP
jgi:Tfp pilus assembly protein PilO